jgi:hypothetical protein
MLRIKIIVLIIALGFVVMAAGIFYGGIFVNVPYPDPTPGQLAGQNFHNSISNYILISGFGIFVLGVTLSIIRLGASIARRFGSIRK